MDLIDGKKRLLRIFIIRQVWVSNGVSWTREQEPEVSSLTQLSNPILSLESTRRCFKRWNNVCDTILVVSHLSSASLSPRAEVTFVPP
eukprot:4191721-Amphidinium_carterae.1